METKLIRQGLQAQYLKRQLITLSRHIKKMKEPSLGSMDVGFHLSLASVYSSMIEGNPIDLDSFIRYESSGININRKSYREIQDLITAYRFATVSAFNERNFYKVHGMLSANLLQEPEWRGKLRDRKVFIHGNGIKVYEGASIEVLDGEMKKFFKDLALLLKEDLSVSEVFYHAAMIHLNLAKIHPFADGNGRVARLAEKWFLEKKRGNKAWMIPSEKLYQRRLKSYYRRLDLGPDYENTNWRRAVPFLLMLPMALTTRS